MSTPPSRPTTSALLGQDDIIIFLAILQVRVSLKDGTLRSLLPTEVCMYVGKYALELRTSNSYKFRSGRVPSTRSTKPTFCSYSQHGDTNLFHGAMLV